jgi:hypothetical protein
MMMIDTKVSEGHKERCSAREQELEGPGADDEEVEGNA